MTIVYLNGDYLPSKEAKIPVFDRGFLFGDSVYEVIPFYNGNPLGLKRHLQRLSRSLEKIGIEHSLSQDKWTAVFNNLLEKNELLTSDCLIYLQVSRGAMEMRNHSIPKEIEPTIMATPMPYEKPTLKSLTKGLKLVTIDDFRWQQNHIKANTLLANVMQLQDAKNKSADDAVLIRDGLVMEGTSSNVFIVKHNKVITPIANQLILGGITRKMVLEILDDLNIHIQERDIKAEELEGVDEIWLTSSSKEIMPVLELNGKPVGSGQPGSVWKKVIGQYHLQRDPNNS